MKPTLADLKKITEILLADELNYMAVRDACKQLLAFFFHITDFDETADVNNEHMQSVAGQAVSPQSAAVCIRDFMRTRVFMRGLKEAISNRLQADPEKAVTVLYAGTGPFATLLLPLVTVFEATQLQMLLLDINPASIAYLNRIIAYFKLEPYVLQVVETDAVTYNIPSQLQPGIILSETMMPSLKTEPQVSIVANLVSQCPGATVIPELIEISAVLYNSRIFDEKRHIHLDTIFTFTKESALQMATAQQTGAVVFPVTRLKIEKPAEPHYSRLALLTYIEVFGKHCLALNDSSLTLPEFVYNLKTITTWPAVFNLWYRIFPVPGFSIAADADNND